MVKANLIERINKGIKGEKTKVEDPKVAKQISADWINQQGEEVGFVLSQPDKIKIQKKITQFYGKTDLAKQIIEIQPFYFDKAKLWWAWNKKEFKWKIIDETDILNIVKNLAIFNTVQSKEKAEILEALKQEARIREPEPIRPTWIQFSNLFIDITTGDEIEASPAFFATNPIPYQLHKERYIETPVMDKIFEEWVGKKYVKTLYEIIAYCMVPDYPLHRIFCLIGEWMNGKSCFLTLLRKFIGDDNVCSTELDTLLSSRFEVTRLHKKLVCQMGETNFNEMNKTSMLKKLSGGDLIGYEYKNKDPFQDINYAKILIATNNLPTTSDKTIGFYRRWMIIDFPNSFGEKKDILNDIPEEEFEILAVKCLGILKDLLDNREFTNQGTIEERREKYESKSNFLEKFIKMFIIEYLDGFITKSEFSKKFAAWSKENKHREMSDTSLGMKMKKLGYDSGQKHFDWMNDGRGGNARTWLGLKWKE